MMASSISEDERKHDAELVRKFLRREVDDRTTAIVVACYLDKYLGELIKRSLPGLNYDLRKKLFDPEGLLGPIGAKIDMAVALGAISPDLQDWCKAVARIRNRFAHNLSITDFSHPEVAKLVEKMDVPEIYYANDSDEERVKRRDGLRKTGGKARFTLVATVLRFFIEAAVFPGPTPEHGNED
jgi:hypothetical protein